MYLAAFKNKAEKQDLGFKPLSYYLLTHSFFFFLIALGIARSLALIINRIEEATRGNHTVLKPANGCFADYTGTLIKAGTK